MPHGGTRLVILEAAGAYRQGLAAAFVAAGHEVTLPTDDGVADAPEAACVAVHDDGHLAIIADWAHRGTVVLGLLVDPAPASYGAALRAGAAGAVDWTADPADIVAAFESACAGRTVVPTEVAQWLAARLETRPRPALSDEEGQWLSALARGASVVELAEESGYSERAMFRRLGDLYGRLGARNRAEALVAAERLGLLEDRKAAN